MICEVCRREFEPQPTKKRSPPRCTCSNSCRAALTWMSSGSRSEVISAAQKRRGAEIAASNHKRWSRPGEREKLSERNRRAWADPEMRARLCAGISARNGSPEARRFYSDMRRSMWRDPTYRSRVLSSLRAAHATAAHRTLMSNLLRARWADPEARERLVAGIRHFTNLPHYREATRRRMLARWAKKRLPKASLTLVRPPLQQRARAESGYSMFDKTSPQIRRTPIWRRLDMI